MCSRKRVHRITVITKAELYILCIILYNIREIQYQPLSRLLLEALDLEDTLFDRLFHLFVQHNNTIGKNVPTARCLSIRPAGGGPIES